MNEVIRQLMERKSARVYTDQKISRIKVRDSSYGHDTHYGKSAALQAITDDKLKQKLSANCDNQPFIVQGNLVLIFCADFQKQYNVFTEGGCESRQSGVGNLLLAVSMSTLRSKTLLQRPRALASGLVTSGTSWKTAKPTGNFCIRHPMCSRQQCWCSGIPRSSRSSV